MFDKERGDRFKLMFVQTECTCVGDYCRHAVIPRLDRVERDRISYLVVCQKCLGWYWDDIPFDSCDAIMKSILSIPENELPVH